MPFEVAFWGDRYGRLRDPFGFQWAMTAPAGAP
jgi:PhnB protein